MNKTRFLLCFVLFLLADSLLAQSNPTATSREIYSKAIQNITKGEFFTAQNQLEQAIAIDSTYQEATLELMRIYFAQKKFEDAERLAKRLIKLDPKSENNWVILSDIYKATENYTGLLTVFNELIKIRPGNVSFYYDKALSLSLGGKIKEAFDLYETIEKKFGQDDRLFIARKDLYMQQNDSEKAISEAKAYIAFKPNKSEPYLMLANVYLDLKKPKEALNILAGKDTIFPEEGYIPLIKADAYQSLNENNQVFIELKKAIAIKSLPIEVKIRTIYNVFQDFDKSIALAAAEELSKILVESHPNQANAQAVYGDVLLQKGDLDKAHATLSKALDLDPKLSFVWEQLIQLEVSQQKLLAAQNHGQKALKLFPNNSMILLFTGYAYMLDKKHEEARGFLEKSLNQANPENKGLMLQVYSSLGDIYHALKMHSASNVAYEEALAIDSNNTYVLNNFAYYLALRKEDLTKAASMSKKSNAISPNNASFQDTYAWVLFQQEKYAEALTWIDKAIEQSEKPSMTLIEHKGDILFKLGNKGEAVKFWKKALLYAGSENTEKLHHKINKKLYVD